MVENAIIVVVALVIVAKVAVFFVGKAAAFKAIGFVVLVSFYVACGVAVIAVVVYPVMLAIRWFASVRESHAGAKLKSAEANLAAAKSIKEAAEARKILSESRFRTSSSSHTIVLDNETGEVRQFKGDGNLIGGKAKEEVVEESPFASLDATQIFEQIYTATTGQQNCPSLIIAGEKRSGKSTFAEWITNAYARDIDFVVVDPKQADPLIKWGPTTRVVGQNQNWKEISDEIDSILSEIKTLKVDRTRRKKIYLLDEWLNLIAVKENKYGEKTFAFMQKVLTELSYLGIGVIVLPHATTATALGFKMGYAQLKSCFDGVFRFEYSLFTGVRKSYFEFKEDEIEVKLWNPRTARRGDFGSGTHGPAHQKNAPERPFGYISEECAGVPDYKNDPNDWRSEKPKKPEITDFYESKAEKYIVEAHRAGVSRRKMFEALGWPVGGRSNEKINNILYKYGVGTDS